MLTRVERKRWRQKGMSETDYPCMAFFQPQATDCHNHTLTVHHMLSFSLKYVENTLLNLNNNPRTTQESVDLCSSFIGLTVPAWQQSEPL